VSSPNAAPEPLAQRVLFVLSAVVPALYYVFAASVFLTKYLHDPRPSTLLWVVSEGLVAALLMVRRPAQAVSRRPVDWAIGIVGSFVALLARPDDAASALEGLGTTIQLTGMVAQILAKTALGRSFGIVAANRGLVRGGPYRLVRHPIYAAYLVSHIGFLICNPTARNIAVYIGVYVLQIARIFAEERVLAEDPAYRQYRTEVRYRLIPGIF
jgi:protein-S-isoprenylcysteine O-methyltransferase Ste14